MPWTDVSQASVFTDHIKLHSSVWRMHLWASVELINFQVHRNGNRLVQVRYKAHVKKSRTTESEADHYTDWKALWRTLHASSPQRMSAWQIHTQVNTIVISKFIRSLGRLFGIYNTDKSLNRSKVKLKRTFSSCIAHREVWKSVSEVQMIYPLPQWCALSQGLTMVCSKNLYLHRGFLHLYLNI